MRCPCRKKSETLVYESCCQPYHAGLRHADSAEALMRSRYAAFALRDAGYLSRTWHRSTRPPHIDFQPGQEWLLLRVVSSNQSEKEATVEFVARSRIGGASQSLHEISRFTREDGQWYYVDGVIK